MDEIVALGSGISYTGVYPVETIIENRKIKTDQDYSLVINGLLKKITTGWAETITDVSWIYVPNIGGYYFPCSQTVKSVFETRRSSWAEINRYPKYTSIEPVSRNYLTIWVDHGKNPREANYAYVILPNKSDSQVGNYVKNPDIVVIENSIVAQAVWEKQLNIWAVNFWEDQEKTIDFITCNRKAAVLISENGGYLAVAISDPNQENNGTIRLELKRKVSR